jgi:hypothetical protein
VLIFYFSFLVEILPIFDNTNAISKRIGFDGTSKTPSLALLKPTASSIGHRIAKIAHSSLHQYSADLSSNRMQISPNPKNSIHHQCIDNHAYSESNMSTDSPFKQPINPFQNVCLDDTIVPSQYHNHSPYLDNKEQHSHVSPTKRPLEHSPFPTPFQRRQSEPVVKSFEKGTNRNVFDPVASQLLYQEETFVSVSSQEEMIDLMDTTTSSSCTRSLSLPSNHRNSSNTSPLPLFVREVSGSLHDVKTEDDLSLLARPVPRKLSWCMVFVVSDFLLGE